MSTWNKITGPRSRALAGRLARVESRNITYLAKDFPIFWESARGSHVRDVDGRTYLDLTSSFAVSSLGHSHPAVRRALLKQSAKMWHGMGDVHPSRVKVELLEELSKIFPGGRGKSILSSSGAEAVESALKTARLYTGKAGVIAFQGAYHGLTYGTLAVTDRKEFKTPFADQIPSIAIHPPYPDSLRGPSEGECLKRVESACEGEKFGAILIEPIQGRGGIRVPGPSFLIGLREISKRYGVLLIVDEIMTGLGRTGRTFAIDHAKVIPDLLCVGKALANGFPISACIGRAEIMAAWPPSDGEAIHTSTFLGNPLGCAMAIASLKEFKSKNLASRARTLGESWKKELIKELGSHPRIGEIRGLGLMIGIEFVKDKKSLAPDPEWAYRIVTSSLQRGLIVLSGGPSRNVLSLTPPLTISRVQLQKATRLLREILYGTSED